MIAIVDYGAGNIHSIKHAFDQFTTECCITRDPNRLLNASKIVVPGQGAFPQAMNSLKKLNLIDPLLSCIHDSKPFLGICLGFQILFEGSDEHEHTKGLSIFPGQFQKIPDMTVKVPHMGWNSCKTMANASMFSGTKSQDYFYFVHSYFLLKTDPSIISAKTTYSQPFISAVQKDTIWGTQFHPEKSSHKGLTIIKNFCNL